LTRRRFLQGVVAGSALAASCNGSARRGGLPNLLVLVSDDQRADSTGFGGGPAATPNLDALASQAAVFDQAFVTTSVCACSRASLLTGQYVRQHGIRHFGAPLSASALARSYPGVLRSAGYHTGFVGKWGLGGALPTDAFDFFEGFARQGRYFHEVDGQRRHLTRMLADAAISFVEDAPPGRPFCLSVSFKAPHGPWEEHAPEFAERFRELAIELPRSASLDAAERLPAFLQRSLGAEAGRAWVAEPELLRENIRNYHRLVAGIDAAVGRLRGALERRGLSDDTVILYTSDNGLLMGEHGLIGKWLMFEESIRVPMLLHLPGERARRIARPVLNVDVAPTLLDLAGIDAGGAMQGRSIAPLARGERVHDWRDDWYYEHDLDPGAAGYLPKVEGIRSERWKYIRYPDANAESLFDLENDPLELQDLASSEQHGPELEQLRARCNVGPEGGRS
jgi:arylsulfatase A-like enzyme